MQKQRWEAHSDKTPVGPTRKPITWQSYADLKLQWPQWLIENILPAQSMICLYGKRSQGKTFVALDWACSIAASEGESKAREWATKSVAPGKVAYLLAENPGGLKRRVHGWIQHHYQTTTPDESDHIGKKIFSGDSPTLLVAQSHVAIDQRAQREALIESLKSLGKLSMIVLDPLVSFMSGSENDTRDMQEFVEGVRDLVKSCGCSVLIVHHEGKGNTGNALGARGSSALEAGMDTVIYMRGVNQYHSELETTKQREARAHSNLMLRFDDCAYDAEKPLGKFPTLVDGAGVKTQATGRKAARKAKEEEKIQIHKIHSEAVQRLHSESANAATLKNIFAELPTELKKSESTTNRILQSLVKDQQIQAVMRTGGVPKHYIPVSVEG